MSPETLYAVELVACCRLHECVGTVGMWTGCLIGCLMGCLIGGLFGWLLGSMYCIYSYGLFGLVLNLYLL